MKKELKYKDGYSIRAFWLLIVIAISLFINPLYGINKMKKGLETVVIDAGHGGKDPGAIVGNAREKDIVLDIALKLGHYIKEKLLTKSSDYYRKALQKVIPRQKEKERIINKLAGCLVQIKKMKE